MNQLIVEKTIENKFIPNNTEKSNYLKLCEKPSDLAIKLAEKTLAKIANK